MDIQTPETLARIGELNDNLHTSFHGGEIAFTHSFTELPSVVKAAALQLVAEFNDFNEDNDPRGIRDYGSFDYCNREFFFKIDFFALEPSDDPLDLSDPKKTLRILTVGLASDL
jgi:hypothetical protein